MRSRRTRLHRHRLDQADRYPRVPSQRSLRARSDRGVRVKARTAAASPTGARSSSRAAGSTAASNSRSRRGATTVACPADARPASLGSLWRPTLRTRRNIRLRLRQQQHQLPALAKATDPCSCCLGIQCGPYRSSAGVARAQSRFPVGPDDYRAGPMRAPPGQASVAPARNLSLP